MIPATLAGVVVFLALLGPGFIYVRRAESTHLGYKVSPFRETVSVAATSLWCNSIALLAFAAARIKWPDGTPDVGEWIHNGSDYFRTHYQIIFANAAMYYALSLFVAFAASHSVVQRFWARQKKFMKLLGAGDIEQHSAWEEVFNYGTENDYVRVGCHLDDGSWVEGWLHTSNPQPDEDDNRAIVLSAPILGVHAGSEHPTLLDGTRFTIIAAAKMRRLDVTGQARENWQFRRLRASTVGPRRG